MKDQTRLLKGTGFKTRHPCEKKKKRRGILIGSQKGVGRRGKRWGGNGFGVAEEGAEIFRKQKKSRGEKGEKVLASKSAIERKQSILAYRLGEGMFTNRKKR